MNHAPTQPAASVEANSTAFDFSSPTQVVFGAGRLAEIGHLVRPLQCSRALLVVDDGVHRAGHADVAVKSLQDAGMEVTTFSDFGENPTSKMIDAGVEIAARTQPDLLVGLGGGSSLDCCKAINFVFSCGGTISDYRGIGRATTDLLPMVAVPTTAGTGSEVQSFAIISDDMTHVKMPCGDRRALPRIAILDPALLLTLPPSVASLTGIDAISHAVETCVTKRRTAVSSMFSREAFRHLATSFAPMLQDRSNIDHAASMQWGATLAGMAIEASMLGAAHATANPLTARYGIAHGQAVGLMLPAVVRLNAATCGNLYGDFVRSVDPSVSDSDAGRWLADSIRGWLSAANLATGWSALQNDVDIQACSADAMAQWTGTFNPVPLSLATVAQLYEQSR